MSSSPAAPDVGAPSSLYRPALGLLTDLYQLTMAYGYWKERRATDEAVFHLFFRKHPFRGGYSVACGIAHAVDLVEHFRVSEEDAAWLATLTGADDRPLFPREFLADLVRHRLAVDIDAVPEGTVVHPHAPLLRVRGPLLDCQLLETALLNVVNFQTLVATKAARVCLAAGGEPVLEFGLRRAQGIDGALAVSRAAYVGGVAATSNVLAGRLYGIPVRGTHAHSWVMSFDDELSAFRAYADALPSNCVFLVDTYDTIEGVKHAITVGHELRARGQKLLGVRLDSGDLALLSVEARRLLDEAGFPDARILASNDLDEHIITSLKQQGARVAVWGVGTRLATAFDEPALGGVYKLGAIRARSDEPWRFRLKLSEQAIKISTPGVLGVRRYDHGGGTPRVDVIHDAEQPLEDGRGCVVIDPVDATLRERIPDGTPSRELLVPMVRGGRAVAGAVLPVEEARKNAQAELARLPSTMTRLLNPQRYLVGLEESLHARKTRLILEARGFGAGQAT